MINLSRDLITCSSMTLLSLKTYSWIIKMNTISYANACVFSGLSGVKWHFFDFSVSRQFPAGEASRGRHVHQRCQRLPGRAGRQGLCSLAKEWTSPKKVGPYAPHALCHYLHCALPSAGPLLCTTYVWPPDDDRERGGGRGDIRDRERW